MANLGSYRSIVRLANMHPIQTAAVAANAAIARWHPKASRQERDEMLYIAGYERALGLRGPGIDKRKRTKVKPPDSTT